MSSVHSSASSSSSYSVLHAPVAAGTRPPSRASSPGSASPILIEQDIQGLRAPSPRSASPIPVEFIIQHLLLEREENILTIQELKSKVTDLYTTSHDLNANVTQLTADVAAEKLVSQGFSTSVTQLTTVVATEKAKVTTLKTTVQTKETKIVELKDKLKSKAADLRRKDAQIKLSFPKAYFDLWKNGNTPMQNITAVLNDYIYTYPWLYRDRNHREDIKRILNVNTNLQSLVAAVRAFTPTNDTSLIARKKFIELMLDGR